MNNPQETYTKAEVDALIAEATKPRYRWPDTFTTVLTSICGLVAWGAYEIGFGVLMLMALVAAWQLLVGYITFGRWGCGI